jgi:hypothetical protein
VLFILVLIGFIATLLSMVTIPLVALVLNLFLEGHP